MSEEVPPSGSPLANTTNTHDDVEAISKIKSSKPSKSILKGNNDLTLNSKTMPIPLKDNDLYPMKTSRRRVSFAPEVTLHKIDFIPHYHSNDRRRETIAFMPNGGVGDHSSSNDSIDLNKNSIWGETGTEALSDSSEDDEDISDNSFLNLEADADKIVNGINRINSNHDEPQSDDDNDEEQTMELTGQINTPKDQRLVANPVATSIPISLAPPAPSAPFANIEDSDRENEDDEQTMDLTNQIPRIIDQIPKISKIEKPQLKPIADEAPQLTSSEDELSESVNDENNNTEDQGMDLTNSLAASIKTNDISHENEMTNKNEITHIKSHMEFEDQGITQFEEVTMEVTRFYVNPTGRHNAIVDDEQNQDGDVQSTRSDEENIDMPPTSTVKLSTNSADNDSSQSLVRSPDDIAGRQRTIDQDEPNKEVSENNTPIASHNQFEDVSKELEVNMDLTKAHNSSSPSNKNERQRNEYLVNGINSISLSDSQKSPKSKPKSSKDHSISDEHQAIQDISSAELNEKQSIIANVDRSTEVENNVSYSNNINAKQHPETNELQNITGKLISSKDDSVNTLDNGNENETQPNEDEELDMELAQNDTTHETIRNIPNNYTEINPIATDAYNKERSKPTNENEREHEVEPSQAMNLTQENGRIIETNDELNSESHETIVIKNTPTTTNIDERQSGIDKTPDAEKPDENSLPFVGSQPMDLTQQLGQIRHIAEYGTENHSLNIDSQPINLTQPEDNLNLIVDNDGTEITSQPMIMTQQFDTISSEAILLPLKRRNAFQESDDENLNYKHAKVDHDRDYETSTTSKIPLAEVSYDETYQDDKPVTLTEFLDDIGIRFYDDLNIGIQPARRISMSGNPEKYFHLEDYYKANFKLPLLEVLELNCKELTVKINQDKSQFDLIKNTAFPENQLIFQNYYTSSFPDQLNLKSQFQLIKNFSRSQAKQVWYDWRIRLMENILTDLQANLEILENDKTTLKENIKLLDTVHDEIKQKFFAIKDELNKTIEIQTQIKKIDTNHIKNIKNKLIDINQQLVDYQSKRMTKQGELSQLLSIISEKESEVDSLKQKIDDIEISLKDKKQYDEQEIDTLSVKFKILQALSNLKYIGTQENTGLFEFNDLIDILINFTDLNDLGNISYTLKNSDSCFPPFHNWALLHGHALKLPYLGTSNSVIDNFFNFKKQWKIFTKLDNDIYKISMKLPVDIIDNGNDDEIVFVMKYYSSLFDFKVMFYATIKLIDLFDYPSKVRIIGNVIRSREPFHANFIIENLLKDTVTTDLINSDSHIVINN